MTYVLVVVAVGTSLTRNQKSIAYSHYSFVHIVTFFSAQVKTKFNSSWILSLIIFYIILIIIISKSYIAHISTKQSSQGAEYMYKLSER